MSYFDKLVNPEFAEQINSTLVARQKEATPNIGYNVNSDDIADAMKRALNEDLSKLAALENKTEACHCELTAFANMLVQISDHLDAVGEHKTAAHLDSAIQKIAEQVDLDLSMNNYLKSPEDITHVIKAALIDTSDKLDALGLQSASDDVDQALSTMAGQCGCSGSCCS